MAPLHMRPFPHIPCPCRFLQIFPCPRPSLLRAGGVRLCCLQPLLCFVLASASAAMVVRITVCQR